MIVAIDGPAASGKSTVARALAERLGAHYLDTGAMYRAIAHAALERGIDLDDGGALTDLATASEITFEHAGGSALPTAVMLDGVDVTSAIRTPAVDGAVSAVASDPGVRHALVEHQRAHASDADIIVVEGRDIGSVVFPDAAVKVFLTASAEERARRRHMEMAGRGRTVESQIVLEELERRDTADSSREASPLTAAPDAIPLDTTGLDIPEVVERIAVLVEERSA